MTKDLVTVAYRLFLGREPENDQAVENHRRAAEGWQSLRQTFLHSPEFRRICSPSVLASVHDLAPHIHIETETDAATLSRMLEHVQRVWTRLGAEEPYWSVLTLDKFRTAAIDKAGAEQFWDSGQGDLRRFDAWLQRNEISTRNIRSVLEYGCGTGRVTAWLAGAFEDVVGYDISPQHLEIARQRLNTTGKRADLRVISVEGLEHLPCVDAVFSILVLQHNPPPVIRYILSRLLRALVAGGVAYFQIPTYRANYEFRVQPYLKTNARETRGSMEMHALPQRVVFDVIAAEGCRVLEVEPDSMTGSAEFISTTFLVQKNRT